ncbi:hypothetical protein TOPH_00817 [Tolypocladium ophioglossoides CBS 100239]|uniref:RutC family protein YjgH n=1 Tax=Tolypocladium ophioglossoides (strain CBS 100239) TaxID=1163406 RepID=A0A0L0NKD8_TOLOC|nr:hypothetical protein TOPH_00817 [Tolypocladium ophioglossoides CBS 100239]
MSAPKYNNPPGIKPFADTTYYSQTADLGAGLIKCAGQGGWTIDQGPLGPIPDSAREQVENAFRNIDHILREAGLHGGARDVYLVRTYHLDIDETLGMVTEGLQTWVGHRPIWTAIGVARLADERMKIEIEVEAKQHA